MVKIADDVGVDTSSGFLVGDRSIPRYGLQQWGLAVAAMLALVVGNGPISVFTFGVFVKPLEAEFGWSRSAISLAVAACAMSSAAASPLAGFLMDRLGVRRPLIVSIVLFGAAVAALSLIDNFVLFLLITVASGIVGAPQSPVAYVKVLSARFDERRGLAIGIAMSGVGLGTAVMPICAQLLCATVGWRLAYVAVGGLIVSIAGPIAALVIQDADAGSGVLARSSQSIGSVRTGIGLRGALVHRSFWILAVAVLSVSLAVNGTLFHLVAMLGDRGWAPGEAVGMMAVAGIAGIVGRILAGALADRLFAPFVGAGFFMVGAVGALALTQDLYVGGGVAALGLAMGAEVDMIGLLVSRYFGMAALGRIYGTLFAVFTVGAGLGPYLFGAAYVAEHSYLAALLGATVALILAAGCLCSMGAYRYPATPDEAAESDSGGLRDDHSSVSNCVEAAGAGADESFVRRPPREGG